MLSKPHDRPWRIHQGRHILTMIVASLLIAIAGGWFVGGSASPGTTGGISVAFLGDVMLGRGVAEKHVADSWETAFAAVEPPLAKSNLVIANLESPVTSHPLLQPGYDLRAPAEAVFALTSAGINAMSLANNHVEDAGTQGVVDTQAALNQAGIETLGPGYEIKRLQVNSHKLGWMAVDGVNHPLQIDMILSDIRQLKQSAEWVVVSVHWGFEYQGAPDAWQREAARQMVLAGADVVAGHHPHVLQPTEWVEVPGSDRRALVLYSLGNALFDQPAPPAARLGAVVFVRLSANGVSQATAIPIQIDVDQGKVELARVENAEAIRDVLRIGD